MKTYGRNSILIYHEGCFDQKCLVFRLQSFGVSEKTLSLRTKGKEEKRGDAGLVHVLYFRTNSSEFTNRLSVAKMTSPL